MKLETKVIGERAKVCVRTMYDKAMEVWCTKVFPIDENGNIIYADAYSHSHDTEADAILGHLEIVKDWVCPTFAQMKEINSCLCKN